MRTADFNYVLPPELIAQSPATERDRSRLLMLDRKTNRLSHWSFSDLLNFLREGDVLVLNDSRVIPARLRGVNAKSGGQFEILLLEENARNDWWVMMKPGKRGRIGTEIRILNLKKEAIGISAFVREINGEGHRRVEFAGVENILDELEALGEIPLPPYIEREKPRADDYNSYQTVYARSAGSVAAPTAGLHFTEELLNKIKDRGVKICHVTLHVGLGTFAPVKADSLSEHVMHEERFDVSQETAAEINQAKKEKRRVVAVGTTTVRVLESVERNSAGIKSGSGKTRIFIYPPYEFKVVDALVTNFHLPFSTLLMLVSAFASPGDLRGREMILSAYEEAVRERYRFFSYGDAMVIF